MKATRRAKGIGPSIIQSLKTFAQALKGAGPLEGKVTVRHYQLQLEPGAYDAKKVKETRRGLGVSQAIFARLLGVSVQAVRSWEQADNVPSGIACRFMDEIRRDPEYWRRRISDSIVPKD